MISFEKLNANQLSFGPKSYLQWFANLSWKVLFRC